MKPRKFAVLGWLVVTATAAALCAEEPQSVQRLARSDWRRVEQIQPQQKIVVHLTNGEIVKGAFVEADLEGVVVLVKGNTTQKLSREEIASIGKASRGKGALLGLAGGAAVGAGMGVLIGAKAPIGHGDVRALAAVTVLGISTGVGTGIGAAIGAEQTLWRAPKPQAKNTH